MKYLFILGRNLELSLAEILNFFEDINDYKLKGNALLVDKKNPISKEEIDNLGGTISFGEVMAQGNIKKIINELDKFDIYNKKENKFNYSVYNFSEDSEDIINYIKERFKQEKLKAVLKPLSLSLNLQNKKEIMIAPHNSDEKYFIFKEGDKNYFGIITGDYDYEEIEKRDMEKPKRRESLAISPRLAKIMINLSKIKKQETLVDPFCGIGAILQEALLKKIRVIGIDKNPKAIEGAKENLKWAKFNPNSYVLINEDSKNIKLNDFEGVVFEPYLGEVLKRLPPEGQAKKTINSSENLVIDVINNLKKDCKGRFVFTLPYIKTIKGRISPDPDRIESKTGLKLIKFDNLLNPIPEFRENQIVGRMIFIMEK